MKNAIKPVVTVAQMAVIAGSEDISAVGRFPWLGINHSQNIIVRRPWKEPVTPFRHETVVTTKQKLGKMTVQLSAGGRLILEKGKKEQGGRPIWTGNCSTPVAVLDFLGFLLTFTPARRVVRRGEMIGIGIPNNSCQAEQH